MSEKNPHVAPSVLMDRFSKGDPEAATLLVEDFYQELRQAAGMLMARERRYHTLRPTELVHEAFIGLFGKANLTWEGRTRFLNLAVVSMRRVLIDHARKRNAQKRGGGKGNVTLTENIIEEEAIETVDAMALYESLDQLSELNPRHARVLELRYLIGLNIDEVASVLDLSPRTVKSDSRFGLAWLRTRLGDD